MRSHKYNFYLNIPLFFSFFLLFSSLSFPNLYFFFSLSLSFLLQFRRPVCLCFICLFVCLVVWFFCVFVNWSVCSYVVSRMLHVSIRKNQWIRQDRVGEERIGGKKGRKTNMHTDRWTERHTLRQAQR